MGNCSLVRALLCVDSRPIILLGNDGKRALEMQYYQIASPSLTGLMNEIVRVHKTTRKQTLKFVDLSAQEIRDIIIKTNRA